jgi:S1-C subfamily serine protease
VLLPDERDTDLASVVTLVNDSTFGTAFFIDANGDLLTAAHLVIGSSALRIVDNTGGSQVVRVLGVDTRLDIAELRVQLAGPPLSLGDPETVQAGDSLVLLASPKNASLPMSSTGVVTAADSAVIRFQADIRPGNAGGPIVGLGGKLMAIALQGPQSGSHAGWTLPITRARADLNVWHGSTGIPYPLAALPDSLTFRGTSTVVSGSSGAAVVQSIQPTRSSRGQDVVVTINGSGFVAGPLLAVRFVPVSSQTGGFRAVGVALAGNAITAKVPAGQVVQDYAVQVTNGDGNVISSAVTFTISN